MSWQLPKPDPRLFTTLPPAKPQDMPVGALDTSTRRQDIVWFLVAFATALVGGVWLLYQAEIFVGDALARAVYAHNVVFSRDPHLAAIGFVWPPLPGVFQIPFVVLLRPIGESWFAPQIMTAVFTGLLAVTLRHVLLRLGAPRWAQIGLVLVTLTNPIVLFSAVNGMTENVFACLILGAVYFLLRWSEGDSSSLTIAALGIGLSFFVRYEAIAFAATGVVAVILLASTNQPRERLMAYLITFLAPFAFFGVLWAFWNQLFVGDYLYFMRALGSNESFTAGIREGGGAAPLRDAFGSLAGTAAFTVERSMLVLPLFLPAVVLASWVAWRRRDRVLLALILFALCTPAFNALQVYRGQLFEWVRFWSLLVLFTPVLAVAAARYATPRRRSLLLGIAIGLMVPSSFITGQTMNGDVSAEYEQMFMHALPGPWQEQDSREGVLANVRALAEALDELPAPAEGGEPRIAIDLFTQPELVLLVQNPKRLIIETDRDFVSVLENAREELDYILIPEPAGIARETELGLRFGAAFASGGPGLEFVEEFTGTGGGTARLYRIVPAS